MALLFLSLGSNIQRHLHIGAALDSLAENFGELIISSVYESESVGFEGDSFYNLVVGIHTEATISTVSRLLKQIEDQNGRDRSAPRFGPRSLDIDILTVDNVAGEIEGVELPRDEVLKNAFVLRPLAEVAGENIHPVTGKTYSQHWQDYDRDKQKLWPVAFAWRGINLPATV